MSALKSESCGRLCARCRTFELEKYLAAWTETSWKRFATVERHLNQVKGENSVLVARFNPEPIQTDCQLCELFLELCATFSKWRGSEPRFELWVHRHTEGFGMVSLSICASLRYYRDYEDRQFWLFPMQQPPKPLHGGRYGTGQIVTADRANIALAKSWLEDCRQEHRSESAPCLPVKLGLDIPLKVIDCETRRVRALHEDESYACLSYVWGKTTANKTFDGVKLPETIEKTIEDAIHVSRQLGIPCLWVDQYCIDQQNLEEKNSTIKAMGQIYGGAEITVISTGDGPLGGLPGIGGLPRRPQRVVRLGVGSYISIGDIQHELSSSPWNSRAWTYQEGMLAPRRLIFCDSQMYFQCNGTHCLESLDAGFHGVALEDNPYFKFFDNVRDAHDAALAHCWIRDYFQRDLTFGLDSLNAIEGVLSNISTPLKNIAMKHFYGIPVCYDSSIKALKLADVIHGLLWKTSDPVEYDPESRCVSLFPSWSWTAIKAVQPSGASELRFPMFDDIPNDIVVSIEHQRGEKMDLLHFLTTYHSASYTEFRPTLGITTWTISSQIVEVLHDDRTSSHEFVGIPNSSVCLDQSPGEEGRAIALYMSHDSEGIGPIQCHFVESIKSVYKYTATFLLVRKIESYRFRRIGRMHASFYDETEWSKVPCMKMLTLIDLSTDIKMKRRKIMLV